MSRSPRQNLEPSSSGALLQSKTRFRHAGLGPFRFHDCWLVHLYGQGAGGNMVDGLHNERRQKPKYQRLMYLCQLRRSHQPRESNSAEFARQNRVSQIIVTWHVQLTLSSNIS